MKFRTAFALLLGAGALALGISGEANAGNIRITNYTSNTNYNNSVFYAITEEGGPNDNYDQWDVPFLQSPSPALQIYSMVWDPINQEYVKLSDDHRDYDTFGWDFYLGVNDGDSLTCDDSLKFKVTDATNLTNPIYAYDALEPGTKYEIPKDGSILIIPLPDLVNQSGEYAHWRLDITPVPEPSTVLLLGMGALAIGVFTMRDSMRRKKKG